MKSFITEIEEDGEDQQTFRAYKTTRTKNKRSSVSKDKILAEIGRRSWPCTLISPLDDDRKAVFLLKYLCLPLNTERKHADEETFSDVNAPLSPRTTLARKLVLFPVQQRLILVSPEDSTPS